MNHEYPQGTTRNEGLGDRTRVLSGWKEIATYLGRGVRTVQRWEKLGLPVRRPNAHLRSAVLSTTDEIDTWMRRCGSGRTEARSNVLNFESLRVMIEQLRSENELLRTEVEALKRRTRGLQLGTNNGSQSASSQCA